MTRYTYYRKNKDTEPILCSVSTAKRLLKNGGTAWTEHFDKDGSFQESTPIVSGNNADTTYRARYNTSKQYNPPCKEATKSTDLTQSIEEICSLLTGIGESENIKILDTILSYDPNAQKATNISLNQLLGYIHARLGHEYRGMSRCNKRLDDINHWKAKTNE